MNTQPALFNVDRTTDQVCPVCAAILTPEHDRVANCQWEQHRDGKRPANCLNRHQPEHQPIPY